MRKIGFLFLVLSIWTGPVFAETGLSISRKCLVYAEADANSRPLCRAMPGDELLEAERQDGGFYRVDIANRCAGFVTDSCINLPVFHKIRKEERQRSQPVYQRFQFGPLIEADLIFTKEPTSSDLHRGWGISGGMQVDIPFWERFRLSPVLKYTRWEINREIASAGNILSPVDNVSQSLSYATVGALVGYTFGARYQTNEMGQDAGFLTFWLEAGAELMLPLSASQSTNGAASVEFTNSDKLLLLVAGAGLDLPLTSILLLGGQLGGFYNLSSAAGSRLFGARAHLTLTLGL